MHDQEVNRIVQALGGKMHSPNSGTCFCPAHKNTKTPALSVSRGHDGRLLLKCHTGCDFNDVLQSLKEKGLLETFSDASYQARKPIETPPTENTARQKDFIQKVINEAIPAKNTLVQQYLYSRGILCV